MLRHCTYCRRGWFDGVRSFQLEPIPRCQVKDIENPGKLYSLLMDLIVRLARYGLIHGDFNEFNLLITATGDPIIIDFPQMVSTSHRNAEM